MSPCGTMVTMICAMTHARVIGAQGGGIPWHLPRDIAHFRAYTNGKFMLVGRKTFQEMNGWFTTQSPLILTSHENFQSEVGTAVHSVAEAMALAVQSRASCELLVSGGAQVYAAALPYADRLVLTIVDADIEGTAKFPDYLAHAHWTTISEQSFPADGDNQFGMTFLTLDRVRDISDA
ncbi:MAG: dihydrofolate reductase [Verrucomicrobiales bacterium]|jgi:dihydrofolate reductase